MTLLKRMLQSVQDILRKADMKLLGLCIICTAFGLVLIASATNYRGHDYQTRRVIIQAAGALLGIGAYFIMSNIDVERLFERSWWLLFLFGLGFIALLRWFGKDDGTGNRAWLQFPGIPVSIQPSEVS